MTDHQDEAFQRGYNEQRLLANPYPDNTDEARRFVDGWVQRIIDERARSGAGAEEVR